MQPGHRGCTSAHISLCYSAVCLCTRCPHANRASTERAARGRPPQPLRNQVQLLLPSVRPCPQRPAQRSILNGRRNGTLHGPAQQPRHKIRRLVVDSANGHVSHLPSWHALAPRPVGSVDVSRLMQAAQRGEALLTGYPPIQTRVHRGSNRYR